MSAIEARRERVRDAFYDSDATTRSGRTDDAIREAMRVKITNEVINAYRPNLTPGSETWRKARRRLTDAFTAAGFEVVDE